MATSAQASANLANAQLSTGPRTETGKAASSQNALKHGFTSRTVLLPGEDETAYRKLCDEALQYWKPVGAPEIELLQTLCDAQWRIGRCARLEAVVLSADIPDFKSLDSISKHESRLKRIYSTTLKEIRDLIAIRLARRDAQMKDAKKIRRADKFRKRESNFQEIGFDLTTADVDTEIRREEVLKDAEKVISDRDFNKYWNSRLRSNF